MPTFPAGRRIAISRIMAIGVMVAFLISVFLCILIGWTVQSRGVDPFLISIDQTTGAWTIVGHSHGQFEYSADRTLQESVVVEFVRDWFTISTDMNDNTAMWNASCDRATQCANRVSGEPNCAIYCACDENVFISFMERTLPNYVIWAQYGEYWTVNPTTIRAEPISAITSNGGKWRVSATVKTTHWAVDGMVDDDMEIIAFVRIARSAVNYPQTMGFYVADFNSYVMEQ